MTSLYIQKNAIWHLHRFKFIFAHIFACHICNEHGECDKSSCSSVGVLVHFKYDKLFDYRFACILQTHTQDQLCFA